MVRRLVFKHQKQKPDTASQGVFVDKRIKVTVKEEGIEAVCTDKRFQLAGNFRIVRGTLQGFYLDFPSVDTHHPGYKKPKDAPTGVVEVSDHILYFVGSFLHDETVLQDAQFHIPLLVDRTERKLIGVSTTVHLGRDRQLLGILEDNNSVLRRNAGRMLSFRDHPYLGELLERGELDKLFSLQNTIDAARLFCQPQILATALATTTHPYLLERVHIVPEVRGWMREAIDCVISSNKSLARLVVENRKAILAGIEQIKKELLERPPIEELPLEGFKAFIREIDPTK